MEEERVPCQNALDEQERQFRVYLFVLVAVSVVFILKLLFSLYEEKKEHRRLVTECKAAMDEMKEREKVNRNNNTIIIKEKEEEIITLRREKAEESKEIKMKMSLISEEHAKEMGETSRCYYDNKRKLTRLRWSLIRKEVTEMAVRRIKEKVKDLVNQQTNTESWTQGATVAGAEEWKKEGEVIGDGARCKEENSKKSKIETELRIQAEGDVQVVEEKVEYENGGSTNNVHKEEEVKDDDQLVQDQQQKQREEKIDVVISSVPVQQGVKVAVEATERVNNEVDVTVNDTERVNEVAQDVVDETERLEQAKVSVVATEREKEEKNVVGDKVMQKGKGKRVQKVEHERRDVTMLETQVEMPSTSQSKDLKEMYDYMSGMTTPTTRSGDYSSITSGEITELYTDGRAMYGGKSGKSRELLTENKKKRSSLSRMSLLSLSCFGTRRQKD